MRIGMMSFAHLHAEAYIQSLRAIPGVEVIGLADENPEQGRRYAQQYQARYFNSYEELLAEKLDGVVICSENNKHRPLVEMAAAAGVHILSEKPLATNVEDARAIVKACEQAGVILMTAFPMRFSAPLMEVKQRLDAGDLGQVFCFNATNQGEMPAKHRAWFVDRTLAGGGAVMDHTVHLADIMRWYLNSEVVEVYAQTNKIFHANEVDVETGGLLMVTFANGVFATIDCSWSRPPYWPSWGGLGFEMVTDRGAVMVDAFKQNVTVYRHDLQRPSWGFWGSDSNGAMLNEFVSAIREKRAPRVTGMDGLRAVEVALAAYRSAETGQPVRLTE
ncbi:MAG TPA: Gfo/Idh/MocA family oxidoreductase [Anaerolineaceae bacterium]|nr:Gfo/Idh/MocA family oxidoreductase [Anaerolineaceae bacterium]